MARTSAAPGIAFDLDGTLIDARQRQVGVAREALAWATGQELDGARFWRAKRGGATTLAALMQLGYAAGIAENVARRWAERIEADDWLERDRPLPGVQRVLTDVRAAGAAITVVTARRRADGACRSIEASRIAPLVDELVVVDPERAIPAKAAELKRCAPAAFIGDTDSDGAASAAAGVPFAAVATGQRSRSYLAMRGYRVTATLSAAVSLFDLTGRSSATPFATTPRTGAFRLDSCP